MVRELDRPTPAPARARPAGGPPHALLGRELRPRVSRRLDAALRPATRLALVAAPPGYGKSVAVAGWVAERGLPCAWIAVEPGHHDPVRLGRDLLAALENVRPGSLALAAMLSGTPDPRAAAAAVLEALSSRDDDLVLVLDDLWTLPPGPSRELVRALLEGLPPFAHPVVVTREDPPLPIGRLRAQGSLAEVRADDLRFTRAEAEALLAGAGLDLPAPLVEELVGRTEGWAAALQLAVLALRDSPDPAAAVAAFSGSQRFVIDYLADEVMAGIDADLATLVLHVSVADRFDAALASLLSGRPDAARLLERAERAGLFLEPAAGEPGWYRLHGLFSGYLRSRLDPGMRARLHGLAAARLAGGGRGAEAIDHALAAGDGALAGRLVAVEGRAAYEAGELARLGAWLDALPPEVLAGTPELVALDAWTRFSTGRLGDAAARAARHLAARAPADLGAPEGRLLVLQALLATATGPDAPELAAQGVALVGDDPLFRSLGLQAAGLGRLAAGDPSAALATLRMAFAEATAAGHPAALLPAVNSLAHALEATGRRDEAEATARRVLDAFRGPSERPLAVAWSALLVLGIARYEAGDLGDARRELERGLAAAGSLGVGLPVMAWAVPHVALARLGTGDPDGALAILQPGPGEGGATGMALPSLAPETAARVHLATGNLAAAVRWAEEAGPQVPAGSPLLEPLARSRDVTVARVRLAQSRPEDALALLRPAREAYRAAGLVPERISALVLEAVAHEARGARGPAREALAGALELAAPGGYVRRFVDDGPGLAPLLRAVRTTAPAFADRVLAALDAARAASQPRARRGTVVSEAADGQLLESLTSRELEVLRCLATGATNAGLAEELGVSAGTVKWHVAHILAKLGARSRAGAVARAQRLGLL